MKIFKTGTQENKSLYSVIDESFQYQEKDNNQCKLSEAFYGSKTSFIIPYTKITSHVSYEFDH